LRVVSYRHWEVRKKGKDDKADGTGEIELLYLVYPGILWEKGENATQGTAIILSPSGGETQEKKEP